MNDVYPIFAKRWYGYGDTDWYWQLFSIHGDEKSAKKTVDRMIDSPRRQHSHNVNPFNVGRGTEFMYQRNMVL